MDSPGLDREMSIPGGQQKGTKSRNDDRGLRRALLPRKSKGPFDGKAKRFATSLVLPVDKNRTGECHRCGACCMFLVRCPFLRFEDGKPNTASCKAYLIRPLQCRKYPRTKGEQIHQPCGYVFKDLPPEKLEKTS